MMFTDPASKVSVPLEVVIRIRSRDPAKVGEVPPPDSPPVAMVPAIDPTQVVEETRQIVSVPVKTLTAAPSRITNPDVLLAQTVWLLPYAKPDAETYPLVLKDPAPICKRKLAVPERLTPLKSTVIRFAQDGMPVKSIAVPEVVACAVPSVSEPPDESTPVTFPVRLPVTLPVTLPVIGAVIPLAVTVAAVVPLILM
jgi:hypothetical protein